jgi:hypothetical protein
MHHFRRGILLDEFLLAIVQNSTTHMKEGQLFLLHCANPRARHLPLYRSASTRRANAGEGWRRLNEIGRMCIASCERHKLVRQDAPRHTVIRLSLITIKKR